MGNNANEHELIASDNLQPRRWKISRIRKANDKKLRTLDRQYRRICNQIRNLGYEELNPPVRYGYERLFVMSEETARSPRADFYINILNRINTIRYSRSKTFKEKKKRRIGKWKYKQQSAQELKEVSSWELNREGVFTEEERTCFYEVEFYHVPSKKYLTKYIFKEPWRFELRIRPHYITKIRRVDLILEQQRDEIYAYLQRDENQRRLTKMRGGNGYAWKKIINARADKKFYAYNSLKNKPLHYIENVYKEEKQWE